MAKKKIPVLATGGMVLTGMSLYKKWTDTKGAADRGGQMIYYMTGMDVKTGTGFKLSTTIGTFAPLLLGVAGTVIASKIGVNRKVSIPYITP